MKRLLLLVLIAIGGILVCEAKVTGNEAKMVAVNWLNSSSERLFKSSDIVDVISKIENNVPLYYIVVFKPSGWVMVSGSEKVDPVLGYSENSRFDKNNIPVQLQGWLGGMAKEVKLAAADSKYLTKSEIKQRWVDNRYKYLEKTQLKSVAAITAGPLLTSSWNQGKYYNELAPLDASSSTGNGHVWIGCVATAMTQVMKYHGYPASGLGSYSYVHHTYGTLSADFGAATYDWGAMPDNPNALNGEVAEINYHAAVSVNMNFAPGGSGAFLDDASNALVAYFKYNSTSLDNSKSSWTDSEWKAQIKRDIDNGRPVIYSGYSPNLSSGHAWVCDGYTDDYFHFNFGWSGSGNGNFLLSAINPSGRDYSSDQGAIFSIDPVNPFYLSTPYTVGFENSSPASFSLTGLYSFSSEEKHSGSSSLCLSKESFSSYSSSAASLAFVVPADANLSFWVKRKAPHRPSSNIQRAVIMPEHGTTVLTEIFSGEFNDSDWQNYTANLTSYVGQKVRLMFIQQNFDVTWDQWMYIDDVIITGSGQNLAPFIPSSPKPANTAAGILNSPLLKWSGGDPNGDLVSYKVYFGTTSNPPFVGAVFDNEYVPGTLLPNRTYYWKIVNSDGHLETDGPVWSFITEGIPPTIGLCGISTVTASSATVCGQIINDNESTITSRGVCWSLTPNPNINNFSTTSSATTSQYSCIIDSLKPFTTYYVSSFAMSNNGMAYSNQQSFSTLAGPPIVLNKSVSKIQRTIATITGTVDQINDNAILSRGVVWSTKKGFEPVSGNEIFETGNWPLKGDFIVNLNNLPGPDTIYYRTFAKNSAGTAYSSEGEFLTVNTSPTIDLDSDNSSGGISNNFNGEVFEQQSGGRIADYDALLSDIDGDIIQQVQIVLFKQLFDNDEFLQLRFSNAALLVEGNGTDTLLLFNKGGFSYSQWSEIVRGVELQINNDAPDAFFSRQVSVRVSDGYDTSIEAIATLNVIPVNDPPVPQIAPAIIGSLVFGQTVKVSPGVWNDKLDKCSGGKQLHYQWFKKNSHGEIDTLKGETSDTLQIKENLCGGAVCVIETITDSDCGGSNKVTATKESEWYNVGKALQTIVFDVIPTKSYTLIPFTLTGTSSSGLPLTFESASLNSATIKGNQVFMHAVGKSVISCNQEGNSCFEPAEKVNRILTIEKGSQEITFHDNLTANYSELSMPLGAESTAGLELKITSSDTSIAYVDNGIIYFAGIGNVVFLAEQTGNNYITPALPVEIHLIVVKGNQTITANVDQNLKFGTTPVELVVDVSSNLSPTISSSNQTIIKVDGNKLNLVGVGLCNITVQQNGNENYNAAVPVVLKIQVAKGEAFIEYNIEPELRYNSGPYSFSARSSSGLPVKVVSENSDLLEIKKNMMEVKGAGNVSITISQEENEFWKDVSETVSMQILKGVQEISGIDFIEKKYGDTVFSLNTAANSNLPVSYRIADAAVASVSNGVININGVGKTTIYASQLGNDQWETIEKSISLNVLKGDQQLFFEPILPASYGDEAIVLNFNSNTEQEITFHSSNESVAKVRGTSLLVKNAGEAVITATQTGNANWNDAIVSQTITINKASQNLVSHIPDSLSTEQKTVFADIETSSGLKIDELISSDESIVKIVGETLELINRGEVEIKAIQYGNENYHASDLIIPLVVSYPVGISYFEKARFAIIPNPASSSTQLNISGAVDFPLNVNIYNTIGELVLETKVNSQISMLNLEGLRQGLYFIKFDSGEKYAIEKLIVK